MVIAISVDKITVPVPVVPSPLSLPSVVKTVVREITVFPVSASRVVEIAPGCAFTGASAVVLLTLKVIAVLADKSADLAFLAVIV